MDETARSSLRRWALGLLSVCFILLFLPARALVLEAGAEGEQVDALQARLYELKYYTTRKVPRTVNDATAERLLEFQRMNGLALTGVVDEATWDALFSEDARSAWGAPLITDSTAEDYVWPALPDDLPDAFAGDGFLPAGGEPYIYASREAGYWCYLSADIRVEIRRITDIVTPLTWYETDIRLRDGQRLKSLMDPHAKKVRVEDPRIIAETYGAVVAVSDDFYGYRKRNDVYYAGIIIRDGEIVNDRTTNSGRSVLPNMDVIALFRDGSMRTFESREYTGQEYLDMGVTDTWAFGPILLRDGVVDERILESSGKYQTLDPRNAIGMIDAGHYLVLTVLGRQTGSVGVRPIWLAQRMRDLGCAEALNLDGGNSIAVVFMGDMINKAEGADVNFMNGIRALSSMIGAGFPETEGD